jgi:hypothetical protein
MTAGDLVTLHIAMVGSFTTEIPLALATYKPEGKPLKLKTRAKVVAIPAGFEPATHGVEIF